MHVLGVFFLTDRGGLTPLGASRHILVWGPLSGEGGAGAYGAYGHYGNAL